MTARAAAAALALLLGGCAAKMTPAPPAAPPPASPVVPRAAAQKPPPPRVETRTVKVACVPKDLPRPPRYPDSDQALKDAGGAADRYQLMAAGRLLRAQRLELLERIVAGCR
jgi:hypothetical protein